MKLKSLSHFLIVLLLGHGLPAPAAYANATPVSVTAQAAILMDVSTGRMLYAKNVNTRRAPASTTKVLTALVAMEHLDLNAVVRVPKFAESIEPSKIHLRAGERYYVRDLIRATLIRSANDAAEVLADAAGGTRQNFSRMMNQKARQLGCKRSNFIRASGLPAKKQYSTAYDLALIMREAQRVPFIASTLRVKTTAITSLDGRRIPLKNHNKLLMRGHNQIIGKTGWTRRARHCFVGQITSSNRTAVVAILGSRSPWKDLKTLIRYQSGRSVSLARRHTPSYNPADIRKLQIALKRAGFYGGPVSGKYGPLTRSAVESFQKAHGLTADGIYGPQTRRAVRPYCFLARFNTRKLQTALQHSGFYEGPISGQYGPLTRAAVKKFQAANGLQRDGICGPQTLQAIRPKL